MNKTLDFEQINREAKKAEILGKIKGFGRKILDKIRAMYEKVKQAFYYILWKASQNPEKAAMVAVAILGSAKTVNKIANDMRDIHYKAHTIWDNHEHHRWNVRRQPTSSEWLEIHDMQAMGYSMGEALEALGLVRRARVRR